jgi:NAD(P)-dependent dehydrogenase (short-subunit alcohol dehydrogenase family)
MKDKIAVILGAAGPENMGQAIAKRFAEEGAHVIVAGRKKEPLESLARELGGEAVLCDLTKKGDVEALASSVVQKHGRIDVAVNCTGWAPLSKLLETTEDELEKLSALQFKGAYFFLQSFVRAMVGSGGGSIITMTSASVHALLYNHAGYIATKAAGEALVRCFANEFGSKGVKVNCIAPGLTSSPMTRQEIGLPGLEDAFLKEYPLGRIGTTDDIANAALWLATAESFLTGQILQINGGLTLRRNPSPKEISASMKAASAAAGQADGAKAHVGATGKTASSARTDSAPSAATAADPSSASRPAAP